MKIADLGFFTFFLVDDSASQSQSSTRSRSERSPSIEFLPEVDIFGRG